MRRRGGAPAAKSEGTGSASGDAARCATRPWMGEWGRCDYCWMEFGPGMPTTFVVRVLRDGPVPDLAGLCGPCADRTRRRRLPQPDRGEDE